LSGNRLFAPIARKGARRSARPRFPKAIRPANRTIAAPTATEKQDGALDRLGRISGALAMASFLIIFMLWFGLSMNSFIGKI
ncbi:MAG TPA: hypothetical protein PKI32_05250, partial [Opitutales bacterium]|nr:hypothetical protein [Opitutales bacterium]